MYSDDETIGRVLSRRQALALLGATGAALAVAGPGAAAAAAPASVTSPPGDCPVDCIVRPEQIEGPYFVDEGLNRSDIRPDPSDGSVVAGTLLTLNLSVQQVNSRRCAPLSKAVVDIWQCDAFGLYSDVPQEGSLGRKFLRGYQITNRAGLVRFLTILPGWYVSRTIHLHVKIRTTGADGKPYEFTSQLYFPERFKASYLATEPYASKGPAPVTNNTDRFFLPGGDQMMLRPRRARSGYTADFAIGLDLSDAETGDDDQPITPPPA